MALESRRGFSLAELLVALTILNLGLLALVASSSAIVRRHAVVRARAAAVRLAAARLELLQASGCGASPGSTSRVDGLVESWSVATAAPGIAELEDRVSYPASGSIAVVSLRTRIVC